MKAVAVIPAKNEAPTVGDVVRAAGEADTTSEVIVVDNGSRDATPQVAKAAGARVLQQTEHGKGQAMLAGVAATVHFLPSGTQRQTATVIAASIRSKSIDTA